MEELTIYVQSTLIAAVVASFIALIGNFILNWYNNKKRLEEKKIEIAHNYYVRMFDHISKPILQLAYEAFKISACLDAFNKSPPELRGRFLNDFRKLFNELEKKIESGFDGYIGILPSKLSLKISDLQLKLIQVAKFLYEREPEKDLTEDELKQLREVIKLCMSVSEDIKKVTGVDIFDKYLAS